MKNKLKLSDLEVQSFVTTLDTKDVKGGADLSLQCQSGTLNPCLTGMYPSVNYPCEITVVLHLCV
jgi:hypothetical protein